MSELQTVKSRILYIQRYLEEQTDEEHPATITQVMAYLKSEGILANRKTIVCDIEQLMEFGVDIVCLLETPELKLLVDAAQASRFLTQKRSAALVKKLLSTVSVHQAGNISNSLVLEHMSRPKNDAAYIVADKLLTAITKKLRVTFMYIEYRPDKKKTYKHNRHVYEFSPWAFVWNNDSYYIFGHSQTHGKAVKFRVDRIAAIKLTNSPAVPASEGFDLTGYVQSVFQMYDGPMLDVTLKCWNDVMKTIIDRFGERVKTETADGDHFYAHVNVSASKTFYGWVFASDGAVAITAPAEAVTAYRAMLRRAKSLVPK